VAATARAAGWVLLTEIVQKLSALGFVVLVARDLGPRSFGYYAFAFALFPLVLVVGSGIDSIVLRDVARDPSHEVARRIRDALRLRLAAGVVGLLLAAAVGTAFVPLGKPYAALVLIGVALLCDQLSSLLLGFFIVFERPRVYALGTTANSVLTLGFAVAAVAAGGSLVAVAAAYLAGSAAALTIATAFLARRVRFAERQRSSDVRELARRSAPLGLAAFLSTGSLRIDTVMLAGFSGPVVVALYNVAYRFFESTLFVAWAVAKAALPAMARASVSADRVRMFEVLIFALLSAYLPLAVLAPFAGRWILIGVFSAEYEDAARVLTVMAASASFYALAHLSRTAAISIGVRRGIVYVAAAAFTFNVGANLIVIPAYGFVGAAWTTLATEVVEAAGFALLFVRAAALPRAGVFVAPLVASAATAGLLSAVGARDAAAIGLAAVAYPPFLLIAGRSFAPSATTALLSVLGAFGRRLRHA
jgi:O-antigen/teichoic acid export membrane protein